ncbi:MAG: hypothetical protein M3444_05660 [Acidobacteriota bacterium]|nr:hypothetical protein [Acidobacteriota bacterium]
MPFSRYQGWEAFKETANIVLLTILLWAFVLTWDWILLGLGVVVELLYLCWASFSLRYKERLESRSGMSGIKFLDGLLLVVTVDGLVIIFFFGFGKHLLSHPWPSLTHAAGWDVGALGWTCLFLFYYTAKCPYLNVQNVDKAIIFAIIFLIIAWLTLPLVGLAGYLIWVKRPILHVICVWLIGICFFVIDLLISRSHPDQLEKHVSKESLKWADTPMVVTFPVLIAYLLWHTDTEDPDVFVSGVVACQLLISNAVFIVMEFGLLRSSMPLSAAE